MRLSRFLAGGKAGKAGSPKATVIVPLYIYPVTSATWQPLLESIDANPTLDFIVIVNPNSGPGDAPWWPNLDYLREVPKLNARPSVTTVGYVRIDYCKRDLADVLDDIRKYASWSQESRVRGLHVQGIFFDETPNEHSLSNVTYLQNITHEAKSADGILGQRLVIHNPGTLPDSQLGISQADITVTFEETFGEFKQLTKDSKQRLPHHERSNICFMVHSVPGGRVKEVTREARCQAQCVFVTDLHERFYEKFGNEWSDFIAAMIAD